MVAGRGATVRAHATDSEVGVRLMSQARALDESDALANLILLVLLADFA